MGWRCERLRNMTNKDEIFKLYRNGDKPDPNCFCHFGWEGTGVFAFEKYALAYYDSAEILFEKFKESHGNYAILDGIGLTMCFLYRHYVELMLKQLYIKFACTSGDDFKEYLENGHNLYKLWLSLKPTLKKLKDRVGLKVNLGSVEHYINKFHEFDESSMSLRYPTDKKLKQNHDDTRLDIYNLHERMSELSKSFENLSYGLSNQLFAAVAEDKILDFDKSYLKLRHHLKEVIDKLKGITFKPFAINDIFNDSGNGESEQIFSILEKCSSDEIILLDTLFYTGRSILCDELKLPKNPYDARLDVKKRCILNMDIDGLEFGKEPEEWQINIWGKNRKSLVQNIEKAMNYLDYIGNEDSVDGVLCKTTD